MEERNRYLKKFYTINNEQLKNLKSKKFEQIEDFYKTRQSIIDIIDILENKIEDIASSLRFEPSDQIKTSIRYELKKRDEIIRRILEQDLEIISILNEQKIEIVKEITSTAKNRKVFGAYNSEKPNKILDQEF